MKNSPSNIIHESRLKPSDLLMKLNEMFWKVEEWIWCFNSMEDLRNNWMRLCAYLLQENKNLDIVELIIEYSIQNWVLYGIDLNQDLWDWRTLLTFIIKNWNYKLFKLINILSLQLIWLYWDTIFDLTIFRNWGDVKERCKILEDLLTYGFQVNHRDIINIIRFSHYEFLRIIWDSPSSKIVLKPKFIREIFKNNNEILRQKPDIVVELITIFAKNSTNQILNWLSEQEIENIVLRELEWLF